MDETLTRVLVATDGSEDAALALRAAADLCRRAGSELHLVHAWRPARPGWGQTRYAFSQREIEEYVGRRRREAERLIEEQAREAEDHGAHVAAVHLRERRPAEEIADLAGEIGADLVVVGSRGLGTIKRLLVGSVAEGVVRLAVCPTLVVRGGEGAWPPGRVVVGDDSSEEARAAGDFAARFGRQISPV
ncbi:MAG: universal stress protein [Rubrobacter sp.]|nr:universal stress protein [Rubrobacter sp.]